MAIAPANYGYDTPDDITARRRFALLALQGGTDTSPASPLAAVARALQGALGGYFYGKANREDKAAQAASDKAGIDLISKLYGKSSATSPATSPAETSAPAFDKSMLRTADYSPDDNVDWTAKSPEKAPLPLPDVSSTLSPQSLAEKLSPKTGNLPAPRGPNALFADAALAPTGATPPAPQPKPAKPQRQMMALAGPQEDYDAAKPAPGATAPMTSQEVGQYIAQSAKERGIDPAVAIRVAKAEGLDKYNGDANTSFGPFQLHYGSGGKHGFSQPGMGNDFTDQTGLDARDPSTVKQQIDFALDHARQNGWDAWYGAKRAGITGMTGISNVGPTKNTQLAQADTGTATDAASTDTIPPEVMKYLSDPRANDTTKAILLKEIEKRIEPGTWELKEVETGLGKKSVLYNSKTQQFKDVPGVGNSDALDGLDGPARLEAMRKTNPKKAALLTDMISGNTLPPGKGKDMTDNYAEAALIQPGWTPSVYKARNDYRVGMAKTAPSTPGGQRNTLLTGIEHLNSFSKSVERMGNVDFMGTYGVNKALNAKSEALGEGRTADFDAKVLPLVEEFDKLYKGGMASEGTINGWKAALYNSNSSVNLQRTIHAITDYLHGKLESMEEQRQQIMGPNSDIKIITPRAIKALQEIEGRYAPYAPEGKQFVPLSFSDSIEPGNVPGIPADEDTTAPAASPPAGTVPPGEYHYDPATGKLVPSQ